MTDYSPSNNFPADFRSGYVAIVGWPNVGKSTLMNAILGFKLSIVSARPQTTREAILGILNEKNMQMIFLDTPGWLKPTDPFQSFMKRAIMRSLYDDADVLVWLIEPRPLSEEEKNFGETLKKTGKPMITVVNKTDLSSKYEPGAFPISARTGQGVKELKSKLYHLLPVSPPYFPTDQITDRWERFYVTELIRENIFRFFQDEVPHACAVVLEEFIEKEGRKDLIKVDLVVETEGQKRILIGKQGTGIRNLGQTCRLDIEKQLGRPVFLELMVKIKKNWRKDSDFLKKVMEGARE